MGDAVVDVITDLCSVWQDKIFHTLGMSHGCKLHNSTVKISREIFRENQSVDKKTHLMEAYMEMREHLNELNADLLSSTKESGEYLHMSDTIRLRKCTNLMQI